MLPDIQHLNIHVLYMRKLLRLKVIVDAQQWVFIYFSVKCILLSLPMPVHFITFNCIAPNQISQNREQPMLSAACSTNFG